MLISDVIKFELNGRRGFINRKGIEVTSPKDNPFVRDFLGRNFEDWKYTGK